MSRRFHACGQVALVALRAGGFGRGRTQAVGEGVAAVEMSLRGGLLQNGPGHRPVLMRTEQLLDSFRRRRSRLAGLPNAGAASLA
ncbi:MAG: hypothetical protein ACRDRO_25785 [Pseudonocardiaceae bacterium]